MSKAKLVLWIAFLAAEAALVIMALPGLLVVTGLRGVTAEPITPGANHPWNSLLTSCALLVLCGFMVVILRPRKTASAQPT